MKRFFPILLLLAGCSSDPGPATSPPRDVEVADSGAPDSAGAQDASSADADHDVDDIGIGSVDAEQDDAAMPQACATHEPAACMANPLCTLDDGCIDASPDDVPFDFDLNGVWRGFAEGSGEGGFAAGEVAAAMSLFRVSDRDVRGVLVLAAQGVSHRVWGGVGPTGELGLYFGPPECDEPICDTTFAPAYAAGGLVTETELSVVDVTSDDAVIDHRSFVSLRLTPSDGFKPVNPFPTRTDPLIANWTGDMLAVSVDGELLELSCVFQIDTNPDGYLFRTFRCDEFDAAAADLPVFDDADSASLATRAGHGWFALGPTDDDLLFVGNVSVDTPWEGVIVRRGDFWTPGAPADPTDVPIEAIRGSFKFFGMSP